MRGGPARPRAAFTLLEILLALAITLLVVLLVLGIFRTISDVAAGQRGRARTSQAAQAAAEQLAADLTALFVQAGDEDCNVRLRAGTAGRDGTDELSFCALQAPPAGRDLDRAAVRRIVWRAAEPGGTSALVRALLPHRAPGATNEQVLVRPLERFRVQLFDGSDWQDAWPPRDDAPPPQGARLEVVPGAGEPVRAEVWIPAGTVITSRLIRAGTPR